MRFIRGLFKALIVLLVLIIIGALLLPASTTVSRSTVIEASPEKIFKLVNGFQRFNQFSPWHNKDPQSEYTYTGPQSGVGARMQWVSDHPGVGSGSSQVIAVEDNRKVKTLLDLGPQGTATSWFELQPIGVNTEVTWGFRSDAGFDVVGRYFNLLLDYFVGKDFEQGLRQLKIMAETELNDSTSMTVVSQSRVNIIQRPARSQLLIEGQSGPSAEDISSSLSQAYSLLAVASVAGGLSINGAPSVEQQYWTRDSYRFTAALPVTGAVTSELPSGVQLQQQAADQAACIDVLDSANKAQTYQHIIHWITDNGFLVSGGSSEQTIPDQGGGSMTQICFPVISAAGKRE